MGIQTGLWRLGWNPCFSTCFEDMKNSKQCFPLFPAFTALNSASLYQWCPFKTHSQKRIWKIFRQCRPLATLPLLESSVLRFCWANCLGAPVEWVLSMGNLLPTPGFHSCLDAVDAPVSRPVFSCELQTLTSNRLPGITIYASCPNPLPNSVPSVRPTLWWGHFVVLAVGRRGTYLGIYGSACPDRNESIRAPLNH